MRKRVNSPGLNFLISIVENQTDQFWMTADFHMNNYICSYYSLLQLLKQVTRGYLPLEFNSQRYIHCKEPIQKAIRVSFFLNYMISHNKHICSIKYKYQTRKHGLKEKVSVSL